jgi:hypothetical protein
VTSERIPKSKIPEALDALRAMSVKELDDIPARDAIRKMRRQIERVLRLGYTYEEVSKTLAGLDINISPERIKYLLNDLRKSTRKKSVTENVHDHVDTQSADVSTSLEDSEIPEAAIKETTITQNNGQSVKKQGSKLQSPSSIQSASQRQPLSQTQEQPATPESKKSKSTKGTQKQDLENPRVEENLSNSRLAFQPQVIKDEDL